MKALDLTGQRFGKLTAIERDFSKTRRAWWRCQCDCGNTKTVASDQLRTGHTKSCGCLLREVLSQPRKHGQAYRNQHTRAYRIWRSLFKRCYVKSSRHYHRYGGRGIEVDPFWFDYENFYADMGDCPEHMSLERVNNNRNYWKGNCVWATQKEQMQNTCTTMYLTWQSQTKSLQTWSELTGIKRETIRQRIHKLNWSVDKALRTPTRQISSGPNKNLWLNDPCNF